MGISDGHFFSRRSSILSEVSTRSSSKLPSGKNILVFGEYQFYSVKLFVFTVVAITLRGVET